jgi:hypothetical protein
MNYLKTFLMKEDEMKTKGNLLMLLGIAVMLALLATPSTGWSKSGGSGEGDISCDAVYTDWKYNPPAYIGQLTLYYGTHPSYGGGLFYYGNVVQKGNRGCSFNIPSFAPIWSGNMSEAEFAALTKQSLSGTCRGVQNLYVDAGGEPIGTYCNCVDASTMVFLEISTVTHLDKSGENEYKAEVEMMSILEKK